MHGSLARRLFARRLPRAARPQQASAARTEGETQVASAEEVAPPAPTAQRVGKPYQIAGNWYHPQPDPDYDRVGLASWYGPGFHGRRTANGETFDQRELTAAHPTLPLPSYVRVTNLANDRSLVVRVNDRGPYHRGRLIDVSERAAEMLDFKRTGSAQVRVEYVDAGGPNGADEQYLEASYRGPSGYPAVEDASEIAVAAAQPVEAPQPRPAPAAPPQVEVAAVEEAPAPPAEAPAAPQQTVAFVAVPSQESQPAREAVAAVTDAYGADDRISMVFDLLPAPGQ